MRLGCSEQRRPPRRGHARPKTVAVPVLEVAAGQSPSHGDGRFAGRIAWRRSGTKRALVGGMDPMVVVGAALVAGGALPWALPEVVAAGLVLAWLAVARDCRARRIVVAGALALALGGARAVFAVRAHEVAMARASVISRTVRCAGTVRVDVSPVLTRGALRWGGTMGQAECEGVVWSGRVTLFGGPSAIARGDDVDVIAQLAPPTRLWNEGDPRPREARQASERTGGIVDARIVKRGTGVLALVDRARERARERIDATFPEDVAPMAKALVLGESDLSPDDDAAMRASGLAHLLAVSGMHLVIAVVTAVAGLRALMTRARRLAERADVGRIFRRPRNPARLGLRPVRGGWRLHAPRGVDAQRVVPRSCARKASGRRPRFRLVALRDGARRRARRVRRLVRSLRGGDRRALLLLSPHRGRGRTAPGCPAAARPFRRGHARRDYPLRPRSCPLRSDPSTRRGGGEPSRGSRGRVDGAPALPAARPARSVACGGAWVGRRGDGRAPDCSCDRTLVRERARSLRRRPPADVVADRGDRRCPRRARRRRAQMARFGSSRRDIGSPALGARRAAGRATSRGASRDVPRRRAGGRGARRFPRREALLIDGGGLVGSPNRHRRAGDRAESFEREDGMRSLSPC